MVIDLPPGLDVCMRDAWLDQTKHSLTMTNGVCHKRTYKLVFEQDEYLPPPPPTPNTACLLSAVQVAKMWKKRQCTKAFLVCVCVYL